MGEEFEENTSKGTLKVKKEEIDPKTAERKREKIQGLE